MIDEKILYITPLGSNLFIRFLNEKCNLSLKDFALKSDINYKNLSRILKGGKAFLDEKTAEKIVKTFGYEDRSFTTFNSFYNITEDIKEWMGEEILFFTISKRMKFEREDSIVFSYYINYKYNLSLEEFAEKIGYSLSSLKYYLRKRASFLPQKLLEKITFFFGFKYKNISLFDNFKVMMLEIYRYYAINKLKKRRGEIFDLEEMK